MLFLSYNVDSTLRALIGQKPMLYQSIKEGKSVFYCLSVHYLSNKEAYKAMYYTVIKHSGHLRTPVVFYHSVINGSVLGFSVYFLIKVQSPLPVQSSLNYVENFVNSVEIQ